MWALSSSFFRDTVAEDEPGGDIAWSTEASFDKGCACLPLPDPRLVGPVVSAAIRDNLETWAVARGAKSSYDTFCFELVFDLRFTVIEPFWLVGAGMSTEDIDVTRGL